MADPTPPLAGSPPLVGAGGTSSAILLEDGTSYLLLEDGTSHLLLESSGGGGAATGPPTRTKGGALKWCPPRRLRPR